VLPLKFVFTWISSRCLTTVAVSCSASTLALDSSARSESVSVPCGVAKGFEKLRRPQPAEDVG
jgi:hypothetical protein